MGEAVGLKSLVDRQQSVNYCRQLPSRLHKLCNFFQGQMDWFLIYWPKHVVVKKWLRIKLKEISSL
jgi:hypothetical protein